MPRNAFSVDGDTARLRLRDLAVIDTFEFAGPNVVPAVVDVDAWWRTTGPAERLGRGDAVPEDDPAAFEGRFALARSRVKVHGVGPGFEFTARGSSDDGFAELGVERNGAFL